MAMRRRGLRTGLLLRAFFVVVGLVLVLVALAFVGTEVPLRDGAVRVDCIGSFSEDRVESLTSSVSRLGLYLTLLP